MRAGSLDREITIERFARTVDGVGKRAETWTAHATVRAQLVQSSTDEFLRDHGETAAKAVIFRVRFLAGITVADRVRFDGVVFDLVQVKELGRRAGLELRCERVD